MKNTLVLLFLSQLFFYNFSSAVESISASQFGQEYIYPAVQGLIQYQKQKGDESIIDQFDFGFKMYQKPNSVLKTLVADHEVVVNSEFLPFPAVVEGVIEHVQNVNPNSVVETALDHSQQYGSAYSRLAFYKGDVFSANSYRDFAFGKGMTGDRLKDFVRSRAWLERVENLGKVTYKVHPEHAGRRILEKLFQSTTGSQITLFRGTFKGEFLLFQFIVDLLGGKAVSPTQIDELMKVIDSSNTSMKYTYNDLKKFKKLKNPEQSLLINYGNLFLQQYVLAGRKVFMSASEQRAARFSRGYMISFTFEKADILKLYDAGFLYVGIEGQIELSFFDLVGFQSLIKSKMSLSKPTLEQEDFMESDYHNPLFNE